MSITFTGRPHPVSLERLADELDTLQAFVLQGLEELAARTLRDRQIRRVDPLVVARRDRRGLSDAA